MSLFEKHAALNQLFAHSPVDAAYLSGTLVSRANFGELSDVDIAILLTNQISSDRFLDYQFYFLSELTKRLESETLDVVILNQASLLLKLQVIKYGQILYSRDEKKRASFESRAVMEYLDFRQMDDLQHQALSRRLRAPHLMLDREGIRAALDRLATVQTHLLSNLPAALTSAEFAADVPRQALAERSLQLAIEALAQIATLVYAGLGIKQPEGYIEALVPLGAREIVPRAIIVELERLLRLRDQLLRAPEQIARPDLLTLAQQISPDLAAFAQAIELFLGAEPPLHADPLT